MKAILVLSLVVNLVLAGVIVHLSTRHPATAPSAQNQPPTAPASAPTTAPAAKAAAVAAATNAAAQAFDWRMVESEDYRKYIANLRSIGCPEETIRDIIIADVNKLYDQRKREATASTNKFQFWKAGNFFGDVMNPERIEKMQALNKEKRELLIDLLGYAPEEKADFMAAFNPFETMLDFLPQSKQNEVMDVFMKYQAKQAKLFEGGGMDEDAMKDMQKLQKQMDAELAGMMSPQDYEEYQLRMSQTAMTMRMSLGSFDPSEQEFRDLFKLRKTYDDEYGAMNYGSATKEERDKANAAQKQLNSQIKSLLGDTRYAEYERSQDWGYQQLSRVAEKAGLPKDSAVKVYDMKKTAEDEAKKIRADKSLSSEQRQAALAAIRTETEKSVQSVLGDKAWSSYQKQNSAYWLKGISPDPKPAPSTTPSAQ